MGFPLRYAPGISGNTLRILARLFGLQPVRRMEDLYSPEVARVRSSVTLVREPLQR